MVLAVKDREKSWRKQQLLHELGLKDEHKLDKQKGRNRGKGK